MTLDETADSVIAARQRISAFLPTTPLVRLRWLDTVDRRVWAKLECNHSCGSFKTRGAFAALSRFERGTTVVTASAGNHGLAIAQAATELGLRAIVCVPVGASEGKVRRIVNSGAAVEAVGRDLAEAIRVGRSTASARRIPFISPFDNHDVVAGQGTIVPELLEQRPEGFDHLFVPFGGGGLFVGIASMAGRAWSRMSLHAVVPAVFDRKLSHRGFSPSLLQPILPTIADGLAVQHDPGSWLAPLIDRTVSNLHQASEREINAAILAMLHQESLLVEGAGAIAITPLLQPTSDKQLKGDILVIVSGSNVSVKQLTLALTDDFPAIAHDRAKLGLAHKPLAEEVNNDSSALTPTRPSACLETRSSPVSESFLAASWLRRLESLSGRSADVRARLSRFEQYVAAEDLDVDPGATDMVISELDLCERAIATARSTPFDRRALSRRYRMALQHYMLANRALDWCCQSSSQVREIMFFDPADVQPTAVNYDRYGTTQLRHAERDMLAKLGFDPTRQTLLLTSSGQAAYSTIEGFLIRGAMRRSSTVITSPYIYFEAMEQLSGLTSTEVKTAPSWRIEDMIGAVERFDASALFVDPIANTGAMQVIDLRELARSLKGHDWSDRFLVVDNTLMSGGFNPFGFFTFPGAPQILLYESLSKYGQLGLDLQMAGAVIAPTNLHTDLRRIRRNCGATLYSAQVHLLPDCSREDFLLRMRRLTANAESLVRVLRAVTSVELLVGFPDDWQALGWQHGGGLVTIRFADPGLNNHGVLEAVIERILDRCRLARLPITKGVSFGFSTTRISAAAAMAGTTDPFLRVSLGDEAVAVSARLAHAIAGGLTDAVARLDGWRERID